MMINSHFPLFINKFKLIEASHETHLSQTLAIFPPFHYLLHPLSHLFLGTACPLNSSTFDGAATFFTVSRDHKLYHTLRSHTQQTVCEAITRKDYYGFKTFHNKNFNTCSAVVVHFTMFMNVEQIFMTLLPHQWIHPHFSTQGFLSIETRYILYIVIVFTNEEMW